MMNDKKLLTPTDVANRLQVNERTVTVWLISTVRRVIAEYTLLTGLVLLPLREALSNVSVWVMASFRTQEIFGTGASDVTPSSEWRPSWLPRNPAPISHLQYLAPNGDHGQDRGHLGKSPCIFK